MPLVVTITTTLGARNGILIRDRLALEIVRQVDVVVFDKTGTLTEGRFGIVGIKTVAGMDEASALALAAAIESDSEHLIAQALRHTAHQRGLILPKISSFEAIKGRGVRALYDGKEVYVGGPRLLEMLHLDLPEEIAAFTRAEEAKARTVVYLCADSQVWAAFAVADTLRPQSREAVQRLHQMGIEVAMLTGDSLAVAKRLPRTWALIVFMPRSCRRIKSGRSPNCKARASAWRWSVMGSMMPRPWCALMSASPSARVPMWPSSLPESS